MPTIDQLAPATAAADSDELPISQNGIARKITRAQILAGVQTQITLSSRTLVGRSSDGFGGPETIALGNNLSLSAGTLVATAAPYSIALSPAGLVPGAGDFVPLGQAGINVSVPYGVFLRGLSAVANVDGSQLTLTPSGGTTTYRLADFASSALLRTGGSLSGPLTLAADPSDALQSATKQYVDLRVNRAGDTLTGVLQLSGDPVAPLHAATKNYVDGQAGVTRLGFTMGGPLVLAGDPVGPLNAATKSYADQRISRAGDTMTGPLGLAADPVGVSQAATKNYVDTKTASALPLAGGVLNGPLTLTADPTTALQAATRQYADTKLAKSGDTLTGALTLAGDPVNALHSASKGYVDAKTLTSLSRGGGTMSGPLLLSGDPTSSSQAATKSYVDANQNKALPLSGGTVTGPLILSVNPAGPAQAVNKQYVDAQLLNVFPVSGGTLSGPLTLAASPVLPLHAATKQYVDANPGSDGAVNVRLPPCNAKLDGQSDDTAAFIMAYQLASPGGTIHVPNGTAVVQPAATWGVPLTKRVRWVIDGTVLTDGSPLADAIPNGTPSGNTILPSLLTGFAATGGVSAQVISQPTDFAVSHSSYVVNHTGGDTQTIIANARTDTIINQSPVNHVWGGMDRLVWNGVQTISAAAPSRHVGRYTQTVRQTVGTDGTGQPLPQPKMWSACVEYRDTTAKPSSWTNASVAMEIDWIGNGVDDAGQRQIQGLILGQNDTTGEPVEVASGINVSLASGSRGKIYRVIDINVPFSTAVLDTSGATQLAGAAAIRMAAGHSIAFDPTNAASIAYSASTGAIGAQYGGTSCAVGKGLAVAFGLVLGTSGSLSPGRAGSIVFLVGGGTYTINLPLANSVMAGTGFTFSVLGIGNVSIVPSGGNSIELGPVLLRQYDRYHIVSDGFALWREVFRTNAIAPHFSGPPVLPSYPVAGLPPSLTAGAKAFASNGRKPAEATGNGSGVEVFYDGNQWISVCSGAQVTA